MMTEKEELKEVFVKVAKETKELVDSLTEEDLKRLMEEDN